LADGKVAAKMHAAFLYFGAAFPFTGMLLGVGLSGLFSAGNRTAGGIGMMLKQNGL